jgi:hypothetical protein
MEDRSHVRRRGARRSIPKSTLVDEELDALQRSLPPAPEPWVERVTLLPQFERALLRLDVAALEDPCTLVQLRNALQLAEIEPSAGNVVLLERLRQVRRESFQDCEIPPAAPRDLR